MEKIRLPINVSISRVNLMQKCGRATIHALISFNQVKKSWLCKFPSFNVFLYLLVVGHSEVCLGSNSLGRNMLKIEMNIKPFVFKLIWYGFVRPE